MVWGRVVWDSVDAPKNPNPFHKGILQEELLGGKVSQLLRPEDEIFYVENYPCLN